MKRPCLGKHEVKKDACHICNLIISTKGYAEAYEEFSFITDDRIEVKASPSLYSRFKAPLCMYQGEDTGEVSSCKTCSGNVQVKLKECSLYKKCSTDRVVTDKDGTPIQCCRICKDNTPVKIKSSVFIKKDKDPLIGIVIGSYKFPGLIDLQIQAIRHYCGEVPILVSDDHSPDKEDLVKVCDKENVFLWENPKRIGHTGGDLAAFWKGIVWGGSLGLDVVCKLSQRFIGTSPRWLQEGAIDLLKSGLPLSTQECVGKENFPLRTEACLLDIKAWNKPEILKVLYPKERKLPQNAEWDFSKLLNTKLGGRFWPWKLISEDRYELRSNLLWHCANSKRDYEQFASQFNIKLGDSFHTDGWQHDKDYIH